MIDFVIFIVPLAAGLLLGYLLRERRRPDLSRVTFGIIMVLIFSLGFGIGSNSEVLESLPRVGLNAVFLAVLAILFSVGIVSLLRRAVRLE